MRIVLLIVSFTIGEITAVRPRRSIGGQPITIEEAPYFISIKDSVRHLCNGVLITPKHGLSSAHCTVNIDVTERNIGVVTGIDIRNARETPQKIEKIVPHRQYIHSLVMAHLRHDIAVVIILIAKPLIATLRIKVIFQTYTQPGDNVFSANPSQLRSRIQVNDKQKPIKWPNEKPRYWATASLVAYGFRKLPNSGDPLQTLETTIAPINRCLGNNPVTFASHSTMFCANNSRDHGMTIDDAGSPLVYNGTLVGMASWSDRHIKKFDYYTNIHSYLRFIKNTTGCSDCNCVVA